MWRAIAWPGACPVSFADVGTVVEFVETPPDFAFFRFRRARVGAGRMRCVRSAERVGPGLVDDPLLAGIRIDNDDRRIEIDLLLLRQAVEDHRRVLDPLVDAGLQRIVLEPELDLFSDPARSGVQRRCRGWRVQR